MEDLEKAPPEFEDMYVHNPMEEVNLGTVRADDYLY